MTLQKRMDEITERFSGFKDWEMRYRHLIEMGKDLSPLTPEQKIEANKVKGCTSQVWLVAESKDNKISFFGDSDSSLVKGIVALLITIYSDATPEEILQTKPTFVDDIELKQHLSPNRANGLGSILKQISRYALAFQVKNRSGG